MPSLRSHPCQPYEVVIIGHFFHEPNTRYQPQRDEDRGGYQQCCCDCEHHRSSILNDAFGLGHIGASAGAMSRMMRTL